MAEDEFADQVQAFADQLDSTLIVDEEAFHSDVFALGGALMTAPDGRSASHAVFEFAARANSVAYTCKVLDEVARTWAHWVLREGSPGLVPLYLKNFHSFVLASRIVGMRSISNPAGQAGSDDGHEVIEE